MLDGRVLKVIKFLKVVVIYASNASYFNSIEVSDARITISAENRGAIQILQRVDKLPDAWRDHGPPNHTEHASEWEEGNNLGGIEARSRQVQWGSCETYYGRRDIDDKELWVPHWHVPPRGSLGLQILTWPENRLIDQKLQRHCTDERGGALSLKDKGSSARAIVPDILSQKPPDARRCHTDIVQKCKPLP